MFITIVWRGSGILVPIILVINAWIVGHWYTDHRIGNWPETGWICFYTAIVVLLHGLLVFPWKREEQPVNPLDGETPKRTLWSHHFFYIPVIFWAVIFGVISALCLTSGAKASGDTTDHKTATIYSPKARIVRIFNPTVDTMIYVFSSVGEDYYSEDTIAPNTVATKKLTPDSYVFCSFEMNNDLVVRIPSDKISNDTALCKKVTNKKGKTYHERVLRPTTIADNDCDNAWVLTNSSCKMILIDVSSICRKGLTKTDVENTDWMGRLTETFAGDDWAEPLYGKIPADGEKNTVLDMSDDVPETIRKGEKIYLLLSVRPDAIVSNSYLVKRIMNYCPGLQAE